MTAAGVLIAIGAVCFGIVVGWVTYRTLRRKEGAAALSEISTVIGAVGGAAVTTLFGSETLFAWYPIGLATGFFTYLVINISVYGKESAERWMGE